MAERPYPVASASYGFYPYVGAERNLVPMCATDECCPQGCRRYGGPIYLGSGGISTLVRTLGLEGRRRRWFQTFAVWASLLSLDDTTASCYYRHVIKSFSDQETEKVYRGERSRKLPSDIQRIARRKLIYLDEADTLQDLLAPPGNRLEALKGGREGQHSIRINDRWRICFTWKQPHAHDVEVTDYH